MINTNGLTVMAVCHGVTLMVWFVDVNKCQQGSAVWLIVMVTSNGSH